MKRALNIALILFLSFCQQALAQTAENNQGDHSYRVLAVLDNGQQIESTSNEVSFIGKTTLYFPNAFTPDQDGHNDTFGAVGLNANQYKLKVFNRWGELLFESENIDHRWDGTFNGQKVQEGVYVYQVEAVEASSGKLINEKGTVTVLL